MQPQAQWHWYLKDSQLALFANEDSSFITAYEKSQILLPKMRQAFSLADCEVYMSVLSHLTDVTTLPQDKQVAIAIHACAAKQFAKPVPAKAWLFLAQGDSEEELQPFELTRLQTRFSDGFALVINLHRGFATCLVVGNPIQISESKVLDEFSLVTLPVDRLTCLYPYR